MLFFKLFRTWNVSYIYIFINFFEDFYYSHISVILLLRVLRILQIVPHLRIPRTTETPHSRSIDRRSVESSSALRMSVIFRVKYASDLENWDAVRIT